MSNTFSPLTGSAAGNAYQTGDKWGFQTAEQVRQSFNALGEMGSVIPLSCSGDTGVLSASFVDVPGYLEHDLNADDLGGFTIDITYYSLTTSAGTSVQLRLRNITDSSTIDASTSITATSLTKETKTITLTAGGLKTYRLQITGGNATNPVKGYATLRIRYL